MDILLSEPVTYLDYVHMLALQLRVSKTLYQNFVTEKYYILKCICIFKRLPTYFYFMFMHSKNLLGSSR